MRAAKSIVILGLVALSVAAPSDARLTSFSGAGTWQGKGTMSGKIVSSGITAVTSGKIVFTLTVSETGKVSGTGTWTWIVESRGPGLHASQQARATLKLSGTTKAVKAAGKWHHLGGTIVVGDVASNAPQLPDKPYVTKLTITKAGPCEVSGTAGQWATWTAVNQRSGCK